MPAKVEIHNCHEAQTIGESLIQEFHTHLKDVSIVYATTSQTRTHLGKTVLATTKRLSPRERWFASGMGSVLEGAEFLVMINENAWNEGNERQKRALVDHELCHIDVVEDKDGNTNLTLRGHTLEEFSEIISRHGLWRGDDDEQLMAEAFDGMKEKTVDGQWAEETAETESGRPSNLRQFRSG